jgi:hypothetical protein
VNLARLRPISVGPVNTHVKGAPAHGAMPDPMFPDAYFSPSQIANADGKRVSLPAGLTAGGGHEVPFSPDLGQGKPEYEKNRPKLQEEIQKVLDAHGMDGFTLEHLVREQPGLTYDDFLMVRASKFVHKT